jgi:hypothetical protein
MKLLASILAAAMATYVALVVVLTHLHALPELMCPSDFSLPGLACRFAALAVTVLLVPVAGISAGLAVWMLSASRSRRRT